MREGRHVMAPPSPEASDEDVQPFMSDERFPLGHPLAPTNVATRKYQIWVSLFPGGNFLAKFSYNSYIVGVALKQRKSPWNTTLTRWESGSQFIDDFS